MKAVLLLLIASFSMSYRSNAQNTNKVWAFGWGCGLDFNSSPPAGIHTGANAYEGCASISDPDGQLLMYATGDTVYNRLHLPMPNGGNMLGTAATIGSCTQGSLILPKPGSGTQYYVFALQGITDGLSQGKLLYSLVDMTLNNTLGDVVPGQKSIQLDAGLGEKLTAVAGTCNNLWIIVCPQTGKEFRAYEITASGISHVPVVSTIPASSASIYDVGVLKAAHNGKKLISANYNGSGFQLFDFDNAQGLVSNPVDFINNSAIAPYSACFSPDDSKLYLLLDSIYQYDLALPTTTGILESKVGISPIVIAGKVCADMQTGPDGKLYIAKLSDASLASIEFPNLAGAACSFNPLAVILPPPALVGAGLPNAVVNPSKAPAAVYMHNDVLCDTAIISSSADTGPYIWSTGDTGRSIRISQPGAYWVSASSGCGTIDSFRYSSCGCTFQLPTAFSPNNDGLNDFFTAKKTGIYCTGNESFILNVFNRWGEVVYTGTEADRGWDGSYKGQNASAGTYMFYLQYDGGKGNKGSKKGDIILVR